MDSHHLTCIMISHIKKYTWIHLKEEVNRICNYIKHVALDSIGSYWMSQKRHQNETLEKRKSQTKNGKALAKQEGKDGKREHNIKQVVGIEVLFHSSHF